MLPGPPGEEPSTPLAEALSHMLNRRGLGDALGLARILTAWEAIAGADLARHVRPASLRRRELVVEVDDPAWATQVRLLAATLTGRLAEELHDDLVDQVNVRVRRPDRSDRPLR